MSAVYNQLGNACFYVGKFHKALEYHKKDLEIAEKIGDRQGQAKAFGNLGNTFKSLKNYPNAVKYESIKRGGRNEKKRKKGKRK